MWNLLLGNGFFVLAMGSKKKGQKEDNYDALLASSQAASAPSAQQQQVDALNQKKWDMLTGKTVFNPKDLPDYNIFSSLYDDARQKHDEGRVGKGLIYSGGKGGEGYNANLMNSIDQQNQEERDLEARAAKEQWISDEFGGLEGKMLASGQADQALRNNNYLRQRDIYGYYLQKKAQPKWWESLLGGGLVAGGQIATKFLSKRF